MVNHWCVLVPSPSHVVACQHHHVSPVTSLCCVGLMMMNDISHSTCARGGWGWPMCDPCCCVSCLMMTENNISCSTCARGGGWGELHVPCHCMSCRSDDNKEWHQLFNVCKGRRVGVSHVCAPCRLQGGNWLFVKWLPCCCQWCGTWVQYQTRGGGWGWVVCVLCKL